MQQARIQQQLHDLRNAAGAVQIRRDVTSGRFQVAQHRHALADALEVIDSPWHFSRMGNGQKCSTALVEPPVAMMTDTAFSMDSRVMMSRAAARA